jgi:hypothetical protein
VAAVAGDLAVARERALALQRLARQRRAPEEELAAACAENRRLRFELWDGKLQIAEIAEDLGCAPQLTAIESAIAARAPPA